MYLEGAAWIIAMIALPSTVWATEDEDEVAAREARAESVAFLAPMAWANVGAFPPTLGGGGIICLFIKNK